MNTEDILQRILNSEELPTLPTVASKLITLTAREDTTLSEIGDLVAKDISLSAKILKVSNSALYSFPQQIGSIKQAVSILGMNAVRSLVLSFSFLTMRGGSTDSRFDFKKFWEKAMASAVAAKLILDHVEGVESDEVFVSGLLQNLGQLILAKTFPEEYEKVLQSVEVDNLDHIETEKSVFGVDHTVIGTEVARAWGFPKSLLQPIQYHHNPAGYSGKNSSLRATVQAVYLSDVLTNILFSEKPEAHHKQFRKEAEKLLGLSGTDIEDILNELHIKVKEAGTYFNLTIKNNKSVQEILQEANIRLSLINLDYEQMNKQLILAKIHLENLSKELEDKNRRLRDLVNIDGLTGVYNHRYFQHSLDQEISRTIRHRSSLSILLIDIDHFKKFNDTFGHQAGDFVLTEFADCIRTNIRQYDTLARYGGEEFVVILPETNNEQGLCVAEKLRTIIEKHSFSNEGETYHVTASFGQASADPADDDDFSKNELISQADKALYEAKKKGRNQVVTYSSKKKWFSF
ncbi:MAG: HDOD domain-containing protein [Desulforhopalus sp.]